MDDNFVPPLFADVTLQKCKGDNQSLAEERMQMEKRKQAAEEARANRAKAMENAAAQDADDTAALDNLLEQLRSGSAVGRRARRARPSVSRQPVPLTVNTEAASLDTTVGNDTVDIARDMLARLKSDGFNALTPISPTTATAPRRSRRREEFKGIAEELESSPMLKLGEDLQSEAGSDTAPSESHEETAAEDNDSDSTEQSKKVVVEEEGE